MTTAREAVQKLEALEKALSKKETAKLRQATEELKRLKRSEEYQALDPREQSALYKARRAELHDELGIDKTGKMRSSPALSNPKRTAARAAEASTGWAVVGADAAPGLGWVADAVATGGRGQRGQAGKRSAATGRIAGLALVADSQLTPVAFFARVEHVVAAQGIAPAVAAPGQRDCQPDSQQGGQQQHFVLAHCHFSLLEFRPFRPTLQPGRMRVR